MIFSRSHRPISGQNNTSTVMSSVILIIMSSVIMSVIKSVMSSVIKSVMRILTLFLSQVYLAQHKYTGKQVAIKVMSQSRISRYLELDGQRVPAEIALIANLSHSSIIQVTSPLCCTCHCVLFSHEPRRATNIAYWTSIFQYHRKSMLPIHLFM